MGLLLLYTMRQETHNNFLVKFRNVALVSLIVVEFLPLWPHLEVE